MNNTILLQQLTAAIAEKAKTSNAVAEDYLRELLATVNDEIIKGNSVIIQGIGEFRPVKDGNNVDIAFVPTKSFAETINAPFAQFEPVEIDDDFDDESLSDEDSMSDTLDEIIEIQKPVQITPSESDEDNFDDLIKKGEDDNIKYPEDMPAPPMAIPIVAPNIEKVETEHSEDDIPAVDNEPIVEEIPAETTGAVPPIPIAKEPESAVKEPVSEPSQDSYGYDEQPSKRFSWMSFFYGLLAGGLISTALFLWIFPPITGSNTDTDPIDAIEPELVDTVEVARDDTTAIVATDSLKVDTITNKRFLATMAREYYGDPAFWVYIYEYNKESLGTRPNRIKPGTKVTIPPAEMYGINASDPNSIELAKQKAKEINKK